MTALICPVTVKQIINNEGKIVVFKYGEALYSESGIFADVQTENRNIHFYNQERIRNKTGVAPLTLRHSP